MKNNQRRFLSTIIAFAMILSLFMDTIPVKAEPIGTTTVKIHYLRADSDYSKWNLWIWDAGNNGDGSKYAFTGKDEDGAFTAVSFNSSIHYLC